MVGDTPAAGLVPMRATAIVAREAAALLNATPARAAAE